METDKQRAADCAFFAFKDLGPLPPEIIAELDAAEVAAKGGIATGAQHALITWMNRDAKKIELRKTYCAQFV